MSEYNYQVSEFLLPAIINGDVSGLDSKDETQLENFMSELQGMMDEDDYIIWEVLPKEGFYGVCDVVGSFTNVYDVKLHLRKFKTQEA